MPIFIETEEEKAAKSLEAKLRRVLRGFGCGLVKTRRMIDYHRKGTYYIANARTSLIEHGPGLSLEDVQGYVAEVLGALSESE